MSSESLKKDKPLLLFVLGGPGAGKGTQCERLVEHFGFEHLSAGDLLRAEMASGSQHGEMISQMIKEGQIVPSAVTVGLLAAAMEKSPKTRFLIDGFPRNAENNDSWLREMADKVDFRFVLFFECSEKVMEERLLGRGATSGRSDDNIDSIRKRFHTYQESTLPVVESYEAKDQCVRINGEANVDQVWDAVKQALIRREITP